MENFKKSVRVIVDAVPYLREIMGGGLIKDLHKNVQYVMV